ncbi:MAG TPA: S41 family peptidase [Bryobacteraceae bacterium]|nr:S41 family peptidase [Bryobacteraceae bacterium]
MSLPRRSYVLAPLVVLAFSALGGLYGPAITGASAASSEDDIKTSLRNFTRVLNVVEENFAEKVTPDKAIYKGAIPGMARTLDPHTSFFDPKDFQLLREDQKGHYYGVGMTVAPRNGKTIVIAPFEGSPAYKAGIRPGDAIIEVNDKRTDGLTTTEVADLLKGPRGTQVQVVIVREGNEKPLTFNITRDEIPRKSVNDAFWLKPGIMYLDIESFNENTSREVEENFKRLGETNVKGLILDLRDNPGGLLNEGVAVTDRFLQKGQLIVSHRGRASAEKPYYARYGNQGRDYPIIVLVNRYSASAAEILAGALQDHDRAWVLGDNTFGKGLVQTVYPLSENTGLALTTAHFYTPSGRLIQRDYTNQSFYNYYYRNNTETKNPLDVKMTDSGRTVYGGGGISPDEKFTSPKLNKFQSELLRKFAFFNFTARYFGSHSTKLDKNWTPDQALMNEFHAFLLKDGVEFTEAEFAENNDWTRQQLRREMYITAFGVDEARKVAVEYDPLVLKAVDSLPKARSLTENAKKMIVQRTQKNNGR